MTRLPRAGALLLAALVLAGTVRRAGADGSEFTESPPLAAFASAAGVPGTVEGADTFAGDGGAPTADEPAAVAGGTIAGIRGTASPFARPVWDGGPDGPLLARAHPGEATVAQSGPRPRLALSAERAQVLLRSLTVPGWGQATLGRNTSATVFGLAELGTWVTFTAFRVQEQMRRDAYIRTARVLAGINLRGRDEEFKRIVGSWGSSDEYNLYVVARDAANLYYSKPDSMRMYIEAHELKGGDRWAWPDLESFLRYRAQRKNAQRAAIRAQTVLTIAVINRLLSAVHAGRASARAQEHRQSWRLEAEPASSGDVTAFRVGVRTRF